jgi:hypothetical protein
MEVATRPPIMARTEDASIRPLLGRQALVPKLRAPAPLLS